MQATEIIEAYVKTFKVTWWQLLLGRAAIRLSDQEYQPASLSAIAQVLASDQIDKMKYEAEGFDCDDFTFALMGAFHHNRETAKMAIFILWADTPEGGHAVCSFHDGMDVMIIEPQTDKVFSPPRNWKLRVLIG